jgi:hypothetical protein
MKLIDEIIE